MRINPYLNFNGQCREAFTYYADVLGGKVNVEMTWGEMPGADQFPAEMRDKIMHGTLAIGDQLIMGSDTPPDRYAPPTGLNVAIHADDKTSGERIFKALADGGKVTMDFQQTFWSPGFGMCVDRYGVPWMVNTASS